MESIKSFPKFTMLFLCIILLEIAGLTVIPTFHTVSKAFILMTLIGFYISMEKRQSNAFILGMIFALLGDCFLLWETDEFFKIGLGSFLIMQICYSVTFNRKRRLPQTKDYIIPAGIVVFGLAVLAILWKDLAEMKIPVALYTTAIVIMAIFAYLRHPKLRGYKEVLLGVVLFIISDSLLGYNKFIGSIPQGRILVMVTYMLAQYFIVTGEVLSGIPRPKVKQKVDSAFARHK